MSRKVQNPHALKWALVAIVTIFGDIGTSFLYLPNVLFFETTHKITPENVLGMVSLVTWTLAYVSLKYAINALDADNAGEGGILALLSLVKQAHFQKYVPTSVLNKMTPFMILGACILVGGDGTLTSGISVASAVEGLSIVTDTFKPFILPICGAILFLLFFSQKWGTERITKILTPVMVAWFPLVALLGIYWIVQYPQVMWGIIDPRYGISFLVSSGFKESLTIGGVIILAATGGEGLYADLGHTTKEGIRRSWFFFVLPSLVMIYTGEGAFLLLEKPITNENIFFSMVQGNQALLIPLVVLATIATSVASLTLITGVQVVAVQLVQLGYLPRLKVICTNKDHSGQIFVPAANWTLFIATIGVLLGFGSSTRMASAYGWGVATLGIMTTVSLFTVAKFKFDWSNKRSILQLGSFLVVDTFFFCSTSVKFSEGAWFPILSGAVMFFICDTWAWGRSRIKKYLRKNFAEETLCKMQYVDCKLGGTPLVVMSSFAFSQDAPAPFAMLQWIRDTQCLPGTILVNSLSESTDVARTRISTEEVCGFTCYTISFGFAESQEECYQLLQSAIPDFNDRLQLFGNERVINVDLGFWDSFRFGVFVIMKRLATPADLFLGFEKSLNARQVLIAVPFTRE
jgi:KUP system potassium uptake protein